MEALPAVWAMQGFLEIGNQNLEVLLALGSVACTTDEAIFIGGNRDQKSLRVSHPNYHLTIPSTLVRRIAPYESGRGASLG